MRLKTFALLFVISQGLFAQSPAEILQTLLEGNKRYANEHPLHADHSSDRRSQLTKGQEPIATILGCSDSRVAPEIIFDQGLGDLFTVRVAGNIAGPIELDSIDYSVKYLGSSLVVVLGHGSCGAVAAVRKGTTADIEDVAAVIQPSIRHAKTLEDAIKANVRSVVAYLKKSRLLKELVSEGSIDCVGAYYHLDSGLVEILK